MGSDCGVENLIEDDLEFKIKEDDSTRPKRTQEIECEVSMEMKAHMCDVSAALEFGKDETLVCELEKRGDGHGTPWCNIEQDSDDYGIAFDVGVFWGRLKRDQTGGVNNEMLEDEELEDKLDQSRSDINYMEMPGGGSHGGINNEKIDVESQQQQQSFSEKDDSMKEVLEGELDGELEGERDSKLRDDERMEEAEMRDGKQCYFSRTFAKITIVFKAFFGKADEKNQVLCVGWLFCGTTFRKSRDDIIRKSRDDILYGEGREGRMTLRAVSGKVNCEEVKRRA